jgi:hypothetical protein
MLQYTTLLIRFTNYFICALQYAKRGAKWVNWKSKNRWRPTAMCACGYTGNPQATRNVTSLPRMG